MRIPVSLIFLTLLLGEITGFILVGETIGVLPTLGLVLFGMIAGMLLLRRQGIATLMKVQADLAANRAPARPLAEGAVLAGAALLIILPGFLTDIAGILLLVPFIREALLQAIRNRLKRSADEGARNSPIKTTVVDLDQSEYDAVSRADTPWRGPEA